MNRELLLTVLIVLAVALSVSTIHASEVNATDAYTSPSDDMYVSVYNSNVDNDSSNDNIMKSDNSDSLSTNTESDDNADVLTSSSESSLSAISTSKTITSSDLTKYYKGSERYSATFYDTNGNVLKNTDVQLTIVGKTYTVKTDSNGVASLAINLRANTYKMVATNPVTGYSLTNTIKVLSTITANDLTKYYKGSEKYSATFRDSSGNLLKNTNVNLTIVGKTYTVKTDSNGVASLSINLKPNTYQMTATNPKNAETLTTNVNVLSTITVSDLTKYYGGSEKYTATFHESNGNLIKSTDVQLTINGKTYTVKTDSKGVASLAIGLKPGTYQMTATNPNVAESKTTKINVLPTVASSDLTKYYGGSEKYSATFYNTNGDVLNNTDVQLTVLTKTYTVKTDSKGVASLAINLKPNTYKLVAANPVTGYNVTNTITVLPTIASSDLTKYYRGSEKYTATFHDTKGNVLKNKNVTFTVIRKTYTVKTDSNGVASLSINLRPNTYQLVAANPVTGYNVTNTITVLPTIAASDLTKYYKGSEKYTATFHNRDGSLLKNTNVNLTIVGKTYTVKTDSKGVASLSIGLKPNTYQMVASDPNTDYTLTTDVVVLPTIISEDISKVYTDGRNFVATFLKNNGKALANTNINFTLDGTTYTRTTDSNGVASLTLTTLEKGTHKIISYNTDGYTKTNTIKVVASTTTVLKPYTYTYLTSDTQTVKVKLLNSFGYAPGAGKDITFNVNGRTYYATTDANGIASATINSLSAGVYSVSYSYGGNSFYTGSTASNKLTIISSKTPTFTVKSETTMGYGIETPFKVALTSGSVPLAGKTVTFTVKGTTYDKTTDSNGIATLPINLAVGKYTISYTNKADSKIDSKTGSTQINVVARTQSSLTWKSDATFYQGTNTFSVLLLDSSSKAISGASVKMTANSKDYTATTGSDGYANFNVNLPNTGTYTIKYSFDGNSLNLPSSGSKSVTIEKSKGISIKSIISAATTVKNYYSSNGKFPDSVSADGMTFTMPEFLYLMTQATYQLGNSNNNAITPIVGATAPSSSSGDTINANLYKDKYLTLANTIANYIKTNKKAPSYGTSDLGKIGYNELVDAYSRVVAYYGANDAMPNYVTIKPYGSGSDSDSYSQTGSGLNEKNTVSNLEPYLKSSTNCPVNNTAIKNLVDSLTSGLSSPTEKAKALYNYVRDSISYTFYYDTRYGAVGTLNAKTGNCVDQAHLLIAMYRTAGLPARYVHGASCTFSSGTYGHVWAQVLIDGNWIVSDPTSSRNSFGKIVNWNTNTFTLKGIYSGIQF